ncbi:MAG: ATP-binding cassette domain-containing protein [Gammaproteobacteria bacterium]
MKEILILATNLGFRYGQSWLWQDLNFEAQAGEILWLQGENGAGKTTLFKLLAGLLYPGLGDLEIKPQARPMLYLPAKGLGFNLDLSAQENFETDLYLQAYNGRNLNLDLKIIFEQLQISKTDQTRPLATLSCGQQQKVLLGKLLINPAKTWLLDEPFNFLDPEGIMLLQDLLKNHRAQGGLVILSQHALNQHASLISLYDRVISLCSLATSPVLMKQAEAP